MAAGTAETRPPSGGAADERPRLAVFAGKEPGCLEELLERSRTGELRADVAGVLSNHATLAPLAADYGVPFQCFGGDDMEAAQLAWLAELKTEVVALARYMQILGPAFCEAYAGRALNVHHSLLPAFPGARPYDAAWARGVKLVGATAHYATACLDEGPIIEQEVERVTHRDSIEDLLRKGRGVERRTLLHALRAHLEDRVVVYGNKTVVFEN